MFSIKHVAQYRYLCLHGVPVAIAAAADGVSLDDVTESLIRGTSKLNCSGVPGSVGQGEAVVGWMLTERVPCSILFGGAEGMHGAMGCSPEALHLQLEEAVIASLTQRDEATPEAIRAAMLGTAAQILSDTSGGIVLSHFAALRIECAAASQWFLVALCDLAFAEDRPMLSIREDAMIAGDILAPPRRSDIDTSKLTDEERATLDRFTSRMAQVACVGAMHAPGERASSRY